VVLDTATRHSHTNSGYNERRQECEIAAEHFGVTHLRDVSYQDFINRGEGLDDVPRRRARHVITENQRVLQAVEALRDGDAARMGTLMNASHTSLREDFEVTNHELNIMVAIAQSYQSCHGARMTGGGFGGCAVALVASDAAAEFGSTVTQEYERETGLTPSIYICKATNGAELIIPEYFERI
jgi:galactokinase